MDKKWEIVFDYLMYLIRENKVKSGDMLPSQNMLKTKFGYSEQPIRIAFNKLIELKIVKSVNGKGFAVCEKISNNLLFSFRELFPESMSKYLKMEYIVCDDKISQETGYQKNQMLIYFTCIRTTKNNEVILFQESYLLKNKFNNLNLSHLNEMGLIKYIENKTNYIVSHSSKQIEFINKNDNEKIGIVFENFNCTGLILDQGKVYDIFGEQLEYRKSYYQPKFFKWNFIEWRK